MLDLEDVSHLPPKSRSRTHWRRLGAHHAQAVIARVMRNLPKGQRGSYIRGIFAGSFHELEHKPKERYYWEGYVAEIELFIDLDAAERRIGIAV